MEEARWAAWRCPSCAAPTSAATPPAPTPSPTRLSTALLYVRGTIGGLPAIAQDSSLILHRTSHRPPLSGLIFLSRQRLALAASSEGCQHVRSITLRTTEHKCTLPWTPSVIEP